MFSLRKAASAAARDPFCLLEEAAVMKGQDEMLEPALSQSLYRNNHLVRATRDDVAAVAKRSDVGLD
jgi:hypothetical protein